MGRGVWKKSLTPLPPPVFGFCDPPPPNYDTQAGSCVMVSWGEITQTLLQRQMTGLVYMYTQVGSRIEATQCCLSPTIHAKNSYMLRSQHTNST